MHWGRIVLSAIFLLAALISAPTPKLAAPGQGTRLENAATTRPRYSASEGYFITEGATLWATTRRFRPWICLSPKKLSRRLKALEVIVLALNTHTISVPMANYDNNQPSLNQNIRLENLWDDIETKAALEAVD